MTHLSDIASDCTRCGGRELFTGRTRTKDGRRWAVLRCPSCRTEGLSWSRAFQPILDAYLAARRALQDPQRYDLAWVLLQDRDPAMVYAIVRALQAGRIGEAPFFRQEDVALPETRVVARVWADLALDYPGFRPEPSPVERIEEALIAALRFNAPACSEAAASRVPMLDTTELESILKGLPVRMGGARAADALVPFFRAVNTADNDLADVLAASSLRWSIPGLRDAVRRSRNHSASEPGTD